MITENCVSDFATNDSINCFMDYYGEFRDYYSRIGKRNPKYLSLPVPSFRLGFGQKSKRCDFGFCFETFSELQNIITVNRGDTAKSALQIQKEYYSAPTERARMEDFADYAIAVKAGRRQARDKAHDQKIKEAEQRYAKQLAQDKIDYDKDQQRIASQKAQQKIEQDAEKSRIARQTGSSNSGGDLDSVKNPIVLEHTYTPPATEAEAPPTVRAPQPAPRAKDPVVNPCPNLKPGDICTGNK